MSSSIVAGFPPETVYFITGITNAVPAVVTLTSVSEDYAFPISVGMTITISKVRGMYELNRNRYNVGEVDTNAKTFLLYETNFVPVDSTNFNTYMSGGEINIISFPPTAGNPPGLMYNNEPI